MAAEDDDPVLSFEVDADWSKFDQELSRRENDVAKMNVKIIPDATFGNEYQSSPTSYSRAFNDETGRLRVAVEQLISVLSQRMTAPAAVAVAQAVLQSNAGNFPALPYESRGFQFTPRPSLEEMRANSVEVGHLTQTPIQGQFNPFSFFGDQAGLNAFSKEWEPQYLSGVAGQDARVYLGSVSYRNPLRTRKDFLPQEIPQMLLKRGILPKSFKETINDYALWGYASPEGYDDYSDDESEYQEGPKRRMSGEQFQRLLRISARRMREHGYDAIVGSGSRLLGGKEYVITGGDQFTPRYSDNDISPSVAGYLLGPERGFTWTPKASLEEMPWRSTQVFHGTYNSGISQFNPFSHFGTREAAVARIKDIAIEDVLPFEEPLTASNFPEKATVYKGRLFYRNMLDLEDDGIHFPSHLAESLSNKGIFPKSHVDWIDHVHDTAGEEKAYSELGRLTRNAGYDAISYLNEVEDRGSTSYMNTSPDQVVPWSQAEANKRGIRYNKPDVTEPFYEAPVRTLSRTPAEQAEFSETPSGGPQALPYYATLPQRIGSSPYGRRALPPPEWDGWGRGDHDDIFEGEVTGTRYSTVDRRMPRSRRLGHNDIFEADWEPVEPGSGEFSGAGGGGGSGMGGGTLLAAGAAGFGGGGGGGAGPYNVNIPGAGGGGGGALPPPPGIALGPLNGPANLPWYRRLGRGLMGALRSVPRAAFINGLFGLFEASRAYSADQEMQTNAAIANSQQEQLQAYISGIGQEFGGLYGATIGAGLDLFGVGPTSFVNSARRIGAGDALTRQSYQILLGNQGGAAYRAAFNAVPGGPANQLKLIQANYAQQLIQNKLLNQQDADQAGFYTGEANATREAWTPGIDPFQTSKVYTLSSEERAQRLTAAANLRQRMAERDKMAEFQHEQLVQQYNDNVGDINADLGIQSAAFDRQINGMSSRDQAIKQYQDVAKEKIRIALRDAPETVKALKEELFQGEQALIDQLDKQERASTAMKDASVKVSAEYATGSRRAAALDAITETANAQAYGEMLKGNFVEAGNIITAAQGQRSAAKADQDRQISEQQTAYGYGTAANYLRGTGRPLSSQIESIEGQRKIAEQNMDGDATPEEWKKMEEYYLSQEALAKGDFAFQKKQRGIALAGERDQIQLGIDRPWDEISPAAIGIRAEGQLSANELLRGGDASGAQQSLRNSIMKEQALRAKYLYAFTGVDEDLRSFDTSNPKTQDDPGVALASIDNNIRELAGSLRDALNADDDDGDN